MPRPDARTKIAAAAPKNGPSKLLIGSIVVAVALILVVTLLVKMELDKREVDASTPPVASSQPAQVVVRDDGSGVEAYPGTAKEGAPTVDIYTDPQCPFCGQFEQQQGEMLSSRAKDGSIKLVYHPKTFLDGGIKGANSERAVAASLCSVRANKYLEYQQAMFVQQPQEGQGYTDEVLKTLGGTAGITGDAKKDFDSCVDNGTYRKYALKLEDYSNTQSVKSTPTVRINGKPFDLKSTQASPTALPDAIKAAATGAAAKQWQSAAPAPSAPGSPAPGASPVSRPAATTTGR